MANLKLAAAFGAADAAKEQDMRGYYPMAARVLADEVRRRKAEKDALAELVAKTGELIEHLQKTGRLAPCFNLPALEAARELTRNALRMDAHITLPMARLIELETAEQERDIFRSERLDLALLVGRLIRRMRAARTGEGLAAGDEALERQCIGYLRRKGLTSPLREEWPNVRANRETP